jgi:hypothetical protein
MKDKQEYAFKNKKGDGNPFAGYLFEDEEILWMDGQKKSLIPALPKDNKTFAILWITGMIIWIAMLSPIATPSIVISTSCGCLFLIGMVYALAAAWPIPAKPTEMSNKGIYALTNRHLFFWDGSKVIERPLESIPYVHLDPGAGSQGTLSFGGEFPAIPNIEDAAYIKTMIEQAQKHRLEKH